MVIVGGILVELDWILGVLSLKVMVLFVVKLFRLFVFIICFSIIV